MKIKASAVLFFVISCFHAQEITDEDAFEKCRKENSRRTCLSDKDKDLIVFYLDGCPDVQGLAEHKGCPDTDGDGIPDKEDLCSEVAGPLENKGGPWPDADGDGIPDKNDACPAVNGPAENNGCPWPDTDGDGIPDKDDPCPTGNINGCYHNNCSEVYKKEEERLENFKNESKDVNFEKLTNKIISDIDKSFYLDKDLIVLTSYILAIEAKAGDCRRENPAPVYNGKNFWTIDAINQISDLLRKNISLGSAYQSFSSPDIDIEYNSDFSLKNVSKFAYKKNIKHLQTLKKVNQSEGFTDNYGMLMITFTNELGNIVKVHYTYILINRAKPFRKKEVHIVYQYLSNDWKILETKEEEKKIKIDED
ncbi:thrombospondin type 3 repeat-containing protein [Chryseobacterium sp. 52]|nr:thrombospondin type 3 repeat-containing protein [Chryseobacterium sp. 52]